MSKMMGTIEPSGRVPERGDWFSPRSPVRREWMLVDLLGIFRRRRAFVLGCTFAVVAIAVIYCLAATPRYLATGQIEVDPQPAGTLGLDRSVTGGSADTSSDALTTSMTLQTDARILRSSTLALMVIKELHLETTADYFPPRRRGARIAARVLFWREPLEPMSVPLDAAPNRRYAVLKIFARHLKVVPVAGTRLIEVSYANPDPKLAAEVVNRLIADLQKYTFESRLQATSQASTWLSGQLAGLKEQTEALQQAANGLEQGTGVYGGDTAHNLVLTRLDALNGALEAAESNRILKQSIYETVKSGNAEMISGLAGNAAAGASPGMNNSLALLQTLRGEQVKVQATIDEDSARYGSAYPMMAELHGRLNGLNRAIQAEVRRIGERARTDYEVAQKAEDAARSALQKQKQLASADDDRLAAYELARQDADGSRNLYQGLLNKLKEAGVLEGLRSTDLTVVSAGLEPPTSHPHSPDVPMIFVMALAAGLFLGCAGALAREAADHSVRSIDDLEAALGVSLVDVVPRHRPASRLARRPRRSTPLAAGSTMLRASLALWRSDARSRTALITSAASGDGKSRLAASLAVSLSRAGARVLLVDADLVRPSLHTLLQAEAPAVSSAPGLAEALATGEPPEAQPCRQIPGLWLVCAGSTDASGSAGLLASPRMDVLMDGWRKQYDVVLVDTAPALAVPDAASLARLCDRTLLVVRYERTAMRAAQRSYRVMRQNLPEHAELDVVMNGVPENSPDYAAYYGTGRVRA